MTATAEKSQLLTNREICRITLALRELGGRRLDGPDPVKRVSTLLRRHFEVPYKIVEDLKNAIIADNPAPDEWDGEDLPIFVAEARQKKINALMDESQEVPIIPANLYLTNRDMPKPIKGELGDRNQFGVALIQSNLGFLFKADGDGEEDGTREEE